MILHNIFLLGFSNFSKKTKDRLRDLFFMLFLGGRDVK